jgi:hypothetical protein
MIRSQMSWTQAAQSGEFRGQWVALDNCRYDRVSNQPVEGDVVDSDEDLAELCSRLQRSSRSKCTILFCDDDTIIEPTRNSSYPFEDRRSA